MDEMNNNNSVNEKLRSFTDMALREAHRRKRQMIEETETEIEQKKKDMEIHLLEEAYRSIQTGTRQNRKELNEEISKALVDGKRKMFNRRNEIIEETFKRAVEKLVNYRKTKDYGSAMKEELIEAIELIGEERYIVYSDKDDMKMFSDIAASLDTAVEVRQSKTLLEGGFMVYGISGKKRVDCSFASRILHAREEFLEICRIPIEDGDLLNEE